MLFLFVLTQHFSASNKTIPMKTPHLSTDGSICRVARKVEARLVAGQEELAAPSEQWEQLRHHLQRLGRFEAEEPHTHTYIYIYIHT